jgi:hypothetical protein
MGWQLSTNDWCVSLSHHLEAETVLYVDHQVETGYSLLHDVWGQIEDSARGGNVDQTSSGAKPAVPGCCVALLL